MVGAGIAGLACAAVLANAGARVTLFDKGRRPGGRVATRRADGVSFDHGAQYVTGHGVGFSTVLASLHKSGVMAPWPQAQHGSSTAWVGVPGMSALPHAMAAQLLEPTAPRGLGRLLTKRHVAFLHADRSLRHWPANEAHPGSVTDQDGEVSEPFDAVLLALPAPQAEALLQAAGHSFARRAAAAVLAPCWAAMAAFGASIDAPDCERPKEGPLGWIARNSGRPGHQAQPDAWVLHATAAWSRAHLEDSADNVAQALLSAFPQAAGAATLHVSAHRWRHALVETPLGEPYLWDSGTGIGVCGDWCLGPRVEAAWDSGTALAHAVLRTK